MRKYTYDYLIVGSGLFGSTFAQIMNGNGKKCLVILDEMFRGTNAKDAFEASVAVNEFCLLYTSDAADD